MRWYLSVGIHILCIHYYNQLIYNSLFFEETRRSSRSNVLHSYEYTLQKINARIKATVAVLLKHIFMKKVIYVA